MIRPSRRLGAMRCLLRSAVAALLMVAVASAAELRPFDAKSMDAIREANGGKPFVLAFWSVSCEPCREEMGLWRAMRRRHAGVPVLLVAADAPGSEAAVRQFLERYNPGPVEHWIFADEFSERVRYSVDRTWRGELPRTYFFDAAHQATAYSGLLDRQRTERWFARQAAAPRK